LKRQLSQQCRHPGLQAVLVSLQQLTAIVRQQQSKTNVKRDRFIAVAWGPESCCAIVQHQVSCMLLPGKELESKAGFKNSLPP